MPRQRPQRHLDNHLTLHAWINSLFGYNTTRDLLHDVNNHVTLVGEGFNPDGLSSVCQFLSARIPPEMQASLAEYDTNIKHHLSTINVTRTQPIVLRYFQYLALLYTEICLDWKINRPDKLLHHLNAFVQHRNDARAPGDAMDTPFTETDLEKLAFWMATGAGKTLIMHINYHQFLDYCKDPLDHIVLITPNEGLSEQHIRELTNSDIPAVRFNVDSTDTHNAIQVTEITKLVIERTGEGESVPVEAFEGNNLIFVDEGHKGSGGEVWRNIREILAETGFTFEYSATFGQALHAARNADLIDEYGKAIAFDYSYRYFYQDGYGKDFRILNVKHDEEPQTETLLLANLLTFYEQRRYFKGNPETVREYGLDPPLWAFVGSKVNAVYRESRRTRSDVLNVLRFLQKFLKNEGNWAIQTIGKILEGDSGLADENGTDIFGNRLNYLRSFNEPPIQIYANILAEVFHTDTRGPLHLQDIKNAPGEIALKTTNSTHPFGLIYIGDTANFKKLVQNDDAGIETDSEDVLTESLFSDINTPDSAINILIGAKKFIEGWDSWRVSAMGLLNIGRQEGSQIIQLFGRGVRLRGKNMSLKRSSAPDGDPNRPSHISLLETLNIFAVRANFMAQFRDYLTREGVSVDERVPLNIPIQRSFDLENHRLYIPKVEPYHEGAKGQCEPLEVLTGTIITHTTQRVDIVGSSTQRGIHTDHAEGALETHIPESSLALVDWENIYLQLLTYKHEKGYHNLIFDTAILPEILNPNKPVYVLTVMDESEVAPTSTAELQRLEALILTLLRKYIAKFYSLIQKQWNHDRLRIRRLGEDPEDEKNFPNWTVHIPGTEAKAVQSEIDNLIETQAMYGPTVTTLPNVYSDRHLYQPLLTNEDHNYQSLLNMGMGNRLWHTTPPALEDSERAFVQDLNSYLRKHPEQRDIFLLRNQSKGKGIGFYENAGFYPDFILWILEGAKQRIVFIEPHGMVHETINPNNDKLTLFKRLRDISDKRFRGEHVQMDSFVISATSLSKLRDKYPNEDKNSFRKKWHILFSNEPNYLDPIFQAQDSDTLP